MGEPKLGTCSYTWQIAKAEVVGTDERGRNRSLVEDWPQVYFCGYLHFEEEPLPPPIERMASVFELRPGDCETCQHWQPADQGMLLTLWRKNRRSTVAKQKRVAKKRAAG